VVTPAGCPATMRFTGDLRPRPTARAFWSSGDLAGDGTLAAVELAALTSVESVRRTVYYRSEVNDVLTIFSHIGYSLDARC